MSLFRIIDQPDKNYPDAVYHIVEGLEEVQFNSESYQEVVLTEQGKILMDFVRRHLFKGEV